MVGGDEILHGYPLPAHAGAGMTISPNEHLIKSPALWVHHKSYLQPPAHSVGQALRSWEGDLGTEIVIPVKTI